MTEQQPGGNPRVWAIGGWVWLVVAVLNLGIVALRLARDGPLAPDDRTAAMLSGLVAAIALVLFVVYRRKARSMAESNPRDG